MGVSLSGLDLPSGVASALGALPRLAPRDATRFALSAIPDLPAVVMPLRGTEQDPDDALGGVRLFFESVRGRVEPVVVSLLGPVSVRLSGGAPVADHVAGTRVLDSGLEALDLAATLAPGTPVLVVLDEPGLVNSLHPSFPISGAEVAGLLTDAVAALSGAAGVGVKVDGRADFERLLSTGISVLAAPVTACLESAASAISDFLADGGVIAWGAVPTDEPLGSSPERLWRRLSALWCELVRAGADPMLLRKRSIITPATGLGDFGVPQAARVLHLVEDLARRVVTQSGGSAFAIGA